MASSCGHQSALDTYQSNFLFISWLVEVSGTSLMGKVYFLFMGTVIKSTGSRMQPPTLKSWPLPLQAH